MCSATRDELQPTRIRRDTLPSVPSRRQGVAKRVAKCGQNDFLVSNINRLQAVAGGEGVRLTYIRRNPLRFKKSSKSVTF